MWLLMSDVPRIGDTGEAIADSATAQHRVDLPIRIGDHCNPVAGRNAVQRLSRSRQYLIPVRRVLRIGYELIANSRIFYRKVLKKAGVEVPPEPVINFAAHQSLVKFMLSAPLKRLPFRQCRMFFLRNRCEDVSPVRKQERIPHIEE